MFAPDPETPPVWCFSVLAAAEASVMPRVLAEFAKRGLCPLRFDGAVAGDDLVIDVQVAGLDAAAAGHVADRLRGAVHVERVLTAVKRRARGARA
jgi:hypothetical protein